MKAPASECDACPKHKENCAQLHDNGKGIGSQEGMLENKQRHADDGSSVARFGE
jgi:hypothetical protein